MNNFLRKNMWCLAFILVGIVHTVIVNNRILSTQIKNSGIIEYTQRTLEYKDSLCWFKRSE